MLCIGAVRHNRLFASCSETEIDSVIKKWLAGSGDRDGGRKEETRGKKRKLKKLASKMEQLRELFDSDSD